MCAHRGQEQRREEELEMEGGKAAKGIEEILIQVGIKLMGYIKPFNHSFKMGTCSLSKGTINTHKARHPPFSCG